MQHMFIEFLLGTGINVNVMLNKNIHTVMDKMVIISKDIILAASLFIFNNTILKVFL